MWLVVDRGKKSLILAINYKFSQLMDKCTENLSIYMLTHAYAHHRQG